MRSFRGFTALSLLAALLLLSGCEQLFEKSSKQKIADGDKKAAAGDVQGAIKLYEASLDGTPKTADSHYKLALLYADKLKSPVDAMHHFERYLALAPNGTYSKEAAGYRKEGERQVLQSLTKGSPITQSEAARLRNENLDLRKTVVDLRKSLADLRAQKSATIAATVTGGKKGEQVQKPIPPGSRTHVVAAGETLAEIATKYYKNKARWKDIQDANFYSLDGTAKIKPGMKLIIP
jgi:LysM repeat protein